MKLSSLRSIAHRADTRSTRVKDRADEGVRVPQEETRVVSERWIPIDSLEETQVLGKSGGPVGTGGKSWMRSMVRNNLASNANIMYTGMKARRQSRRDGTPGLCHLSCLHCLPWLSENVSEGELGGLLLNYIGRDGMGRLDILCFLLLLPYFRPFTDRESFCYLKYLRYHFDTLAPDEFYFENGNVDEHSKYNVASIIYSSVSTLYAWNNAEARINGSSAVEIASIACKST